MLGRKKKNEEKEDEEVRICIEVATRREVADEVLGKVQQIMQRIAEAEKVINHAKSLNVSGDVLEPLIKERGRMYTDLRSILSNLMLTYADEIVSVKLCEAHPQLR